MGAAAPWHAELPGAEPARVAWLRAADGRSLRAAMWRPPAPRGLVWLLAGRTEYLEKYALLAAGLMARGLAVAGVDWRGQGLSERAPGAGRLGHVEDFAEYQRDLEALLGWSAAAEAPGPRLLLAHSMGGCIGLRALLDGRLAPEAALFSAPMWGLSLGLAARWTGPGVARSAVWLGLGLRPAPGQGAAAPYVVSAPFEGNVLVSDPEVWERFRREVAVRPEFATHGPTLGWLDAAFREMAALARAPAAATPGAVLLGEEERVVSPSAVRLRVARSPATELIEVPGARHEPLMEPAEGPAGRRVAAALEAFAARAAARGG